ncbi:MAG: DUF1697 domain-containing protein [Cyclobacteriaceae bacterium]|nr:DUF1697 domain-containing protein [Cyclobacteriaceae bacterium]
MVTYISILRGANVSGRRNIKMKDLKALYENIGLCNVITYIQSGNVIFRCAETSPGHLSEMINQAITRQWEYHIPVFVYQLRDFKQIYSSNPFIAYLNRDITKLHVTFLFNAGTPSAVKILEEQSFPPDEMIIRNNEIYLYCPNGYGQTKLTNTFFERKLNSKATTRNWKTLTRLLELADTTYE